eukprot:25345_1
MNGTLIVVEIIGLLGLILVLTCGSGGARAANEGADRVKSYDAYVAASELYDKGDFDSALEKFREALNFDKANSDVLSGLGALYLDLAYKEMEEGAEKLADGYTAKSLSYFERAVESNPYHAISHLYIGIHNHPIDQEKALFHYELATEADPSIGEAWSHMGDILQEANRIDEAIEAYEQALEVFKVEHQGTKNEIYINVMQEKIDQVKDETKLPHKDQEL